ncbi:hypothetical protein DFH94DRAFT_157725 [Russula ochroleuca]|jgi:zinc finger protein 830|uniref:Zinc finger protein 830 n=1 Tax=Russula ochroleuca TaxID=152965 RepID=A0A9P5TDF8_9AGAM|nr:hypothetical protein DFH94DRAFT_157725 [Russula ochroleuca]
MADVRALLKAKRQEARITHPYAAYGASGALRCTACGAAIKFASAWEGHLGSKAHRVAVANLKAVNANANANKDATTAVSKRKVEGEEDGLTVAGTGTKLSQEGMKKRQRTEEPDEIEADDDDDANAPHASHHHAFPEDFFSDPARAPPPPTSDDDDDEMDQDQDGKAKTTTATATAPAPPKSQFDMEWAAFERDLQSLRQQRPAGENDGADVTTTTYAHATIAAEPELVPRFEGLPASSDPSAAQEGAVPEAEQGTEGRKKVLSEEKEKRRRKERDERELIMDRLLEEERAQEDAYGRVALLKNRIQMLKKKRELAKAKGGKKAADTET